MGLILANLGDSRPGLGNFRGLWAPIWIILIAIDRVFGHFRGLWARSGPYWRHLSPGLAILGDFSKTKRLRDNQAQVLGSGHYLPVGGGSQCKSKNWTDFGKILNKDRNFRPREFGKIGLKIWDGGSASRSIISHSLTITIIISVNDDNDGRPLR